MKYFLLVVSIIVFATSCYKDEITFRPNFNQSSNAEQFLSQFLNINSYYEIELVDDKSFITLQDGSVMEISPKSFKNKDGIVLEKGIITAKITQLKKGSSDIILAPSLQNENVYIDAEKCFKIAFFQKNQALSVVNPIGFYISSEGISNISLKLFNFGDIHGVGQWSELIGENNYIESGIWTLSESVSFKGIKLNIDRFSSWLCLGNKMETLNHDKINIRVNTDPQLNSDNTLAYFIDKSKNTASKLKFDNGSFLHEVFSNNTVVSGYLLIISDNGDNAYPFALKEVNLIGDTQVINLPTTIKTKEQIKSALSSL